MSFLYKGKEIPVGGGGSGGGGGSSEEVYSTEETRIGTWIDGKPLYRKVIVGNTGANNTVDLSSLGIDTVVSVSGMMLYVKNNVLMPLSNFSPTTNSQFGLCIRNMVLTIEPYAHQFVGQPAHVILEYTKTTD